MTNEEFIESVRLEGEEWRLIPNFERYMVSNKGRVIAISRVYKNNGVYAVKKPRIMKQHLDKNKVSYYHVQLCNDTETKSFSVHRLVASVFIPNPLNLPQVNHKDENSHNNNLENLEWCDAKYNCNYGTHNERMANTINKTAYQRKPIVQLDKDNTVVAKYDSIAIASRELGMYHSLISKCCQGVLTQSKGRRFMYLSDYEKSLANQ